MPTTPTNIQPLDGEVGLRWGWRVQFQWTKYVGAGALTEQRLRIYSDAALTALVHDTLLRPIDAPGGVCGDGWWDVYPEDVGLAHGTQYWWTVVVRDDVPSTSSASAATSFTLESKPVTAAVWRQGQ